MDICSFPQFYDPQMPISIWRKNLPHIEQLGKVEFVTFRLGDAMPRQVMIYYKNLKEEFLRKNPYPWNNEIFEKYSELITNPLEKYIDAGYGSCILKYDYVRKYMIDCIQYYDGDRYCVWAYVIMPNHVHMLISPCPGYDVVTSIKSIMKYSAVGINRHIGRKGRLWQGEPFDTLIRNSTHYANTLEYIKKNPQGLSIGTYEFGGLEFMRN